MSIILEEEQFKLAYNLINKKVKNDLTIITPDILGQDYLLHISLIKQKYLVPNVSKFADPSEDNTVLRIHTSNNLIGCIIGYARLYRDAMKQIKRKEFENKYYIYKVPFKFALEPNKNLVYDVEYSKEKWLITYNKETMHYPIVDSGYFIINNFNLELNRNNYGDVTYNILVNIKNPINVDDDLKLNEGYYMLDLEENFNIKKRIPITKCINYEKISKDKFENLASKKTFSLERRSTKLFNW